MCGRRRRENGPRRRQSGAHLRGNSPRTWILRAESALAAQGRRARRAAGSLPGEPSRTRVLRSSRVRRRTGRGILGRRTRTGWIELLLRASASLGRHGAAQRSWVCACPGADQAVPFTCRIAARSVLHHAAAGVGICELECDAPGRLGSQRRLRGLLTLTDALRTGKLPTSMIWTDVAAGVYQRCPSMLLSIRAPCGLVPTTRCRPAAHGRCPALPSCGAVHRTGDYQ